MDHKKTIKHVQTSFGSYCIFQKEGTGAVSIEWQDVIVKHLIADMEKYVYHTIGMLILAAKEGQDPDIGMKRWMISNPDSVSKSTRTADENGNIVPASTFLSEKYDGAKIIKWRHCFRPKDRHLQ